MIFITAMKQKTSRTLKLAQGYVLATSILVLEPNNKAGD